MLILTRKIGESIQVGDDIRIKIVEIGRNFVKIGVDAPRSVKVHREEIYERIREENIQAGQAGTGGLSRAAELLKRKKPNPVRPLPPADDDSTDAGGNERPRRRVIVRKPDGEKS